MNDIDIKSCLRKENITPVSFADKDIIFTDENIRNQAGYTKLPSGDYLVAMVCPMPGITKDMIEWWFWWHAQKSARYRMWYPGEHFAVFYSKKDKAYFQRESFECFSENTQYPIEKIGPLPLPLSIDFTFAEKFGFSAEKMKQTKVSTVVCGTVGALFGLVKHTKMAHIFFETDEGLYMVSRFWIGEELKNPVLRKIFLKEKVAKDMAEHCFYEYRNLAALLPSLTKEMQKGDNDEG